MRIPRKMLERNPQPLTFMWERHREIARRLVAGEKPINIAKAIGMTPGRLSVIMASPVFREHVGALSKKADSTACDLRERISEGAREGVEVLLKLLKGDSDVPVSPQTRAKIAMDFLDRDGYAPVKQVRTENLNATLTRSDIEELKAKRAEMMRRAAGLPTTVEVNLEAV